MAAAVIQNGRGEYLICRRPEGKHLALLWEFPGGKLEPGETAGQCLVREIAEELGAGIGAGEKIGEVTHEYPGGAVHIVFLACRISDGVPSAKEHSEIRWVKADRFPEFEFCPADTGFVRGLAGTAPDPDEKHAAQ